MIWIRSDRDICVGSRSETLNTDLGPTLTNDIWWKKYIFNHPCYETIHLCKRNTLWKCNLLIGRFKNMWRSKLNKFAGLLYLVGSGSWTVHLRKVGSGFGSCPNWDGSANKSVICTNYPLPQQGTTVLNNSGQALTCRRYLWMFLLNKID